MTRIILANLKDRPRKDLEVVHEILYGSVLKDDRKLSDMTDSYILNQCRKRIPSCPDYAVKSVWDYLGLHIGKREA